MEVKNQDRTRRDKTGQDQTRQDTVSIIIPTYNRPKLLYRAIESCIKQTHDCEIVVIDSSEEFQACHPGVTHLWRPEFKDHPVASWWYGLMMASGEYATLLFDDDWLEPTFVSMTLAHLTEKTAFVFTEATIHLPDNHPEGPTRLNIRWDQSGYIPTYNFAKSMVDTPFTVSPACCLMRRQDMLNHLFINKIPGWNSKVRLGLAGPDALMVMMPLFDYELVGHINIPLCNFWAKEGSTTIDEMMKDNTDLEEDYRAVKGFFKHMSQTEIK